MKKTVFIIILSFIVVGLTGFIAYDSFFKPKTKCNVKTTTKTETKEKTSEERYKDYLTNLSKSIEDKYSESNDGNGISINEDYYTSGVTKEDYKVYLSGKKELYVCYISSEDPSTKIAENVVKYYNIYVGNGGYKLLYYITAEGKLYSIDVESIGTKVNDPKEITEKNIVEVRSGVSTDENGIGARIPIFVDIDGNIIMQ